MYLPQATAPLSDPTVVFDLERSTWRSPSEGLFDEYINNELYENDVRTTAFDSGSHAHTPSSTSKPHPLSLDFRNPSSYRIMGNLQLDYSPWSSSSSSSDTFSENSSICDTPQTDIIQDLFMSSAAEDLATYCQVSEGQGDPTSLLFELPASNFGAIYDPEDIARQIAQTKPLHGEGGFPGDQSYLLSPLPVTVALPIVEDTVSMSDFFNASSDTGAGSAHPTLFEESYKLAGTAPNQTATYSNPTTPNFVPGDLRLSDPTPKRRASAAFKHSTKLRSPYTRPESTLHTSPVSGGAYLSSPLAVSDSAFHLPDVTEEETQRPVALTAPPDTGKCLLVVVKPVVGTKAGTDACHRRRKAEALHQCEICPSTFTALHNYKYHMRAHSGIKNFHCKDCDKSFTNKGDLRRHEKYKKGKDSHR